MRRIYLLLIVFIGLTLWACTKSSVTGNQSPTRIRLINAMPAKSFDLVLNSETLQDNIPYDSATPFLNGPAGFYKLLIHENGSTDTLINGNQYLQAGEKYSLFLIPDSSNRVDGVKLSVVTDNETAPLYDSAKFRFFNFAPDTTSVSVVRLKRKGISTSYDTIFPYLGIGRTYLDNSLNSTLGQYKSIYTDPFQAEYLFLFLKTNDPGVIIDSFSMPVEKGKFYTCYYEGYDSLNTGDYMRKPVVIVSEQ
ncbi:protein of unknown function [Arachidicoccus rhizosphaerae]|uniref:DUF4397 domain-containing protein n=1 Tax=Arachidicoccus rhizosphaerae TaxID=551991 RepID=A0A1H3VF31_9BACT|nr:DUF4397 domain-containing protein [Arachidicoccus rhizosphaerae]SDZ73395.1 protein of unknown function [Arachidicoccus rhizosphaerae]